MQMKKSPVQVLITKFTKDLGLPFQKLLPESLIEDILVKEKIKYRNRLFSPIVTLWAFLSQVLDTDKSCHNAVSRIIAWLAGEGEDIPSEEKACLLSGKKTITIQITTKIIWKSRTGFGVQGYTRIFMRAYGQSRSSLLYYYPR